MCTKVGLFCCLLFIVFSQSAQATFLPPNKLHLQSNIQENTNMTQAEFIAIIDSVTNAYLPIISAHGANLTVNKLWDDVTVNASASQSELNWTLNMYGGLARRIEVTSDGFATVVCHELGHHLGGFAFYSDTNWAASEGQSDYFATHACLPLIWKKEVDENAKYRGKINKYAKEKCDSVWTTTDSQNLCYRINAAGESLAQLLAALNDSSVPHFETPDTTQVENLSTEHPAAQCRLDTYLAGSLCTIPFDNNIIPGRNLPEGQNSIFSEEISKNTSCHAASGLLIGIRPRCWYKPYLDFKSLHLNDLLLKETLGNRDDIINPGEHYSLNMSITNKDESQNTSNITGKLWTNDSDIKIHNAYSKYPNLQPNETGENASPFLLEVSNLAKCGTNFTINAGIYSDRGSFEFEKSFLIGKLVDDFLGINATIIKIPDNDTAGIVSNISSENELTVNKVVVSVSITHPYPDDLILNIEAPNGQIYPIKKGSLKTNINKSFEINTTLQSSKGIWKLKISDISKEDIGILNSWSIKTFHAECN